MCSNNTARAACWVPCAMLQVADFKQNVLALANIAKTYKMETVITSSIEDGPNGPIWPEIHEMLPDAAYVPRLGEINAWDSAEFVKAVKVPSTLPSVHLQPCAHFRLKSPQHLV
jgi:nicotinamidase-related amidase